MEKEQRLTKKGIQSLLKDCYIDGYKLVFIDNVRVQLAKGDKLVGIYLIGEAYSFLNEKHKRFSVYTHSCGCNMESIGKRFTKKTLAKALQTLQG